MCIRNPQINGGYVHTSNTDNKTTADIRGGENMHRNIRLQKVKLKRKKERKVKLTLRFLPVPIKKK
jgi:hypothetical protein